MKNAPRPSRSSQACREASVWDLFLLLLVILSGPVFAAEQNGIGIQVGTTGGITFYHELDQDHFAQAAFGTYWYNGFYIAGDYCFQYPGAFHTAPALTPYVGVGPMIATGTSWRHDVNYTAFGMHIPVGINLRFPKAPVHAFLQIGPAMMVTPYTDSFLDADLGVRFLF